MSHVLIVDDDAEICQIVSEYLTEKGLQVATAGEGIAMFAALKQQSFDLIILDIMLPNEDGLTLCQKLHQLYDMPILMLSAAATESDRVVGLEVGADDYLAKPFSLRELYARIRALIRREQGRLHRLQKIDRQVVCYQFANWLLDTNKRVLQASSGQEIKLSSGEYDLLLAFIRHQYQILTRSQLLDLTQRGAYDTFDRAIDSKVRRLRVKLEKNPKQPDIIKTVRSGGYCFRQDVVKLLLPLPNSA